MNWTDKTTLKHVIRYLEKQSTPNDLLNTVHLQK